MKLIIKNIFSSLLIILVATNIATAQKTPIQRGNMFIEAGVGVLPTYFKDQQQVKTLPVTLRATYQINDNISLGAYAAYSNSVSNNITYLDGSKAVYTNNTFMTGLRAVANTTQFNNFNIYGGFQLGYAHSNVDAAIDYTEAPKSGAGAPATFFKPGGSKVNYSGFVGAYYFLNDNTGLYGEVGYGISILNFGLTYRI